MSAPRPSERDQLRYIARVYLREAARRRGQAFAATLLQWAKNTRNRSNALLSRQFEMFRGQP